MAVSLCNDKEKEASEDYQEIYRLPQHMKKVFFRFSMFLVGDFCLIDIIIWLAP